MSLLIVNGLGKAFRSYRSELQRFARWFSIPIKPCEEHWVLRHVNFDVQAGESIGILGQNGAGKSTLLKMITGTLHPSEGQVQIHGRIAAILELGMGFDPELTGRQNVYHVAGLMGFTSEQIQKAMSEIEDFAEIGEYFDEPVRIYSSGMQMRVAFSLAVGFPADILIVDEAMAVGDAYFQQKCSYRIKQFQKAGGTLLFVSHDPNMIKTLCSRAILLDNGRLVKDGLPKDVMDLYQGLISQQSDMGDKKISTTLFKRKSDDISKRATSITTNGDAELVGFFLENKAGEKVVYLESEQILTIKYKVKLNKYFDRPAFGLIIRDRLGNSVFEASSYSMNIEPQAMAQGSIVIVNFSLDFNLRCGQYSFSIGVSNKGYARSEFEEISLLMHDVEQIQVIESPSAIYYGGIYNMKPDLNIEVLEYES